MNEKVDGMKAAAAAAIGLLTGLWGWLGWLVVFWVAFMVLDYITGSAAACKQGDWASRRAREGIWHKAGMVVVVIVAAGADLLIEIVLTNLPVLSLPIAYPGLVCPVVLVWYIVTELGSMAENAAVMGAPVPQWLTRLLAVSRDVVDNTGDRLTEDDGNGDG